MTDSKRSGAKIRLLTRAEVELLGWECGGPPYCRSRGCTEKARWWCSIELSCQTAERPSEYCNRHASEFALEHGLDTSF